MTAATARDWDAIVIGAGPAGSALARRLAARHRVMLLERAPSLGAARVPSAWRIGESLPGAAGVLLRRLGLFERFAAAGHAPRGATVSAWDTAAPVWFDSVRDPNGPGWHLDRARFDAMLRDAAREAGAVLVPARGRVAVRREGARWRVRDGAADREYAAATIVDATGRGAAVHRGLGLRRHAEDRLVCAHALLAAPAGDADRCTRLCADEDGWWYSVRVPSGRRVLAFHLDADDPALRALRDPVAFLARARRLPLLAQVLPAIVEPAQVHMRPAGGAAADMRDHARWPDFYAVGDAALAFDPIASQGLFHALASAESAAAAIARRLDGDDRAERSHFDEMERVRARYADALAATYARPAHFAARRFWARRNGSLARPG
ncbi:MAG: tryptophan 7-halogenase [Tagaea sp.]|nr:tryptophan 7-halogenase [Tagaea sp.]